MSVDFISVVALAALGLAVGSFLNVCIHRLPVHASIVSPGSACPSCRQPLRWFDNIPVVSYAWLAGRCRSCQAAISIRYPLVEMITSVLFVCYYLVVGADPRLVPLLLFASAMTALFVIDLEHYLLPNVITLPGIIVGFLFSLAFPPGPLSSALGIVAGGGSLWLIGEIYYRVAGREGMGGGDVKMLAMIGAFLGWPLVIVTLVLSSFAGAAVGLLLMMSRRGTMRQALPYGTFLALAGVIASLFGHPLIDWYVSFYQ